MPRNEPNCIPRRGTTYDGQAISKTIEDVSPGSRSPRRLDLGRLLDAPSVLDSVVNTQSTPQRAAMSSAVDRTRYTGLETPLQGGPLPGAVADRNMNSTLSA